MATTAERPHAVLTNVFRDNNRGGAAITRATMDFTRRLLPGCSLTLISIGPHGDDPATSYPITGDHLQAADRIVTGPLTTNGPFGGLRAVVTSLWLLLSAPRRSARWTGGLAAVRDADLVVSKGGFVFVARRSLRALMSFWVTVFPLVLATRCGVPTVVYGASIGPFSSRLDRAINRFVLRRISVVMPRDPISVTAASDLGVGSQRLVEMPDSVFSLKVEHEVVARELLEELRLDAGSYLVATARLRGPADRPRLSRVAEALAAICADGETLRVVLVRQVTGPGTTDLAATEFLAAELRRHSVEPVVVDRDLDITELVALYGGGRLTVACRLHSAILSLLGGTPSVTLEMDGRKAEGVFRAAGLERFVLRLDDVTVEQLADTVRGALDHEDDVRAQFRAGGVQFAERCNDAEREARTVLGIT